MAIKGLSYLAKAKSFDEMVKRLIAGFKKVMNRDPNDEELIKIKIEAGERAGKGDVIKADFGESPFPVTIKGKKTEMTADDLMDTLMNQPRAGTKEERIKWYRNAAKKGEGMSIMERMAEINRLNNQLKKMTDDYAKSFPGSRTTKPGTRTKDTEWDWRNEPAHEWTKDDSGKTIKKTVEEFTEEGDWDPSGFNQGGLIGFFRRK